jgi:Leucine-rich repeat (LRR) protein
MAELAVEGIGLKELTAEQLNESLVKIDASDNTLTVLPAEIGACVNLEELLLFANQLKILPKELGALPNLKVLNLFNNKLMKLPVEIGNLANLEEVRLAPVSSLHRSAIGWGASCAGSARFQHVLPRRR